MTLVILAAGLGSRYGGNKQLEAVGPDSEIILDYSIYDAVRAGFDKAVIVIRKEDHNLFSREIASRFSDKIKVEFAFQGTESYVKNPVYLYMRSKPWGTGHALLCCREHIKENFAVINADDFYGKNTYKELYDHLNTCGTNEYCLVGYRLENTIPETGSVSRGICYVDDAGYLKKIKETKNITKNGDIIEYNYNGKGWIQLENDTVVSMTAFGMTPDFFDILEEGFYRFLDKNREDPASCEYYLPDAVQCAMDTKGSTVRVIKSSDNWYGVTSRADREFICRGINDLIDQGEYPKKLFI